MKILEGEMKKRSDCNNDVISRYGSDNQKRQLLKKAAYDKAVSEAEWRKQAVEGWSALLKEAELGTRMYSPNDAMVIGVLGENCFDSFKEYKEFQNDYPSLGFTQLASAMVDMNKTIIGKMNKVAGISDKPSGMVKTARSEKKYLKSEEVIGVLRKVAASLEHDEHSQQKIATVIGNLQKKDRVSLGSVKTFMGKYGMIEHTFLKMSKRY